MISQPIKFCPAAPGLNKNIETAPKPALKVLPEWYRKADRFAVNPHTNKFWENPDGSGKIPTWKACPAIFDVMTTGYVLLTPCDIEFFLNKNKKISVKILEKGFDNFVTERAPMPQFINPMNCYEDHFAWFPSWAPKLPEGYSALYVSPLNRFDLPFVMTSGIIDNDKVNLPGSMPFFIQNGFQGIIKKGTPFAQILPFKRENWESEVLEENLNSIQNKLISNNKIYRKKDGGVYKNEVWSKREYK
jgi:hypothetical protein